MGQKLNDSELGSFAGQDTGMFETAERLEEGREAYCKRGCREERRRP